MPIVQAKSALNRLRIKKSAVFLQRTIFDNYFLAGAEGFEPPNAGTELSLEIPTLRVVIIIPAGEIRL
jgi:hypothetical protein